MQRITTRLLLSWGACRGRRAAFSAQFPGGATPNQALAWATHDDLRWIVYYAPEAYKARAWSALLGNSPAHEDLRWIVAYAPEAYAKKAKEALCKK